MCEKLLFYALILLALNTADLEANSSTSPGTSEAPTSTSSASTSSSSSTSTTRAATTQSVTSKAKTYCRCIPGPPPTTATAPSMSSSTSKSTSKTTTTSRSASTGMTMLSSTSTTGTGHSALQVTLRAYSGLRDPVCYVQPGDAVFLDLYSALQAYVSTPLLSILGYRGFEVQSEDGFVNKTVATGSNYDLEILLLYSCLDLNDPGTAELIRELLCELTGEFCETVSSLPPSTTPEAPSSTESHTVTQSSTTPQSPSSTETSTSSTSPTFTEPSTPATQTTPTQQTTTEKPCKCPTYKPGAWNNDRDTKKDNNCYNYATDSKTDTFAQPGRGAGNIYGALTGPAVQAAAERDGLKTLGDPGAGKFPKTDNCLVALVIWKGKDFHWYRRDKNGNWSHKRGETAATNLDDNGNVITDPRTAAKGSYKFVTFMSYCPKDITVNR